MKIVKVNNLPQSLEADTFYIVKSSTAGLMDFYVTDSTGLEIRALPIDVDVIANLLPRSEVGVTAASLVDGKIPVEQLPSAILGTLSYKGTWNANTNTPAIPTASESNKGWYYVVSVSGATNIDGGSDWVIGDWIVSDGTAWGKVDNSDRVSSVAGKTGVVVLAKADVGLGNVDNTSDADKPVSTAAQTALNAKQDTLVSGTNIKTINGTSVLGSGNLVVEGGGGLVPGVVPVFAEMSMYPGVPDYTDPQGAGWIRTSYPVPYNAQAETVLGANRATFSSAFETGVPIDTNTRATSVQVESGAFFGITSSSAMFSEDAGKTWKTAVSTGAFTPSLLLRHGGYWVSPTVSGVQASADLGRTWAASLAPGPGFTPAIGSYSDGTRAIALPGFNNTSSRNIAVLNSGRTAWTLHEVSASRPVKVGAYNGTIHLVILGSGYYATAPAPEGPWTERYKAELVGNVRSGFGKFWSVFSNSLQMSEDGITWTPVSRPEGSWSFPLFSDSGFGLCHSNPLGITNLRACITADGENWEVMQLPYFTTNVIETVSGNRSQGVVASGLNIVLPILLGASNDMKTTYIGPSQLSSSGTVYARYK